MACSLNTSFLPSLANETLIKNGSFGLSTPLTVASDFMGKPLLAPDHKGPTNWNAKAPDAHIPVRGQASICVSKAMRWWEKTLKPNMIEINSAQQLVDSLSNAGDRLVVVDFYSPGCGGCKALHPKICQLAESHPNAIFLKVNYEELKPMCYALRIHVLPFFRFYRGAEGRVCSFSCTNATIKKFKDALAKYGTDASSLGPAKGLEDSELLALASIGQISVNLPLKSHEDMKMGDFVLQNTDPYVGLNGKSSPNKKGLQEEGSTLLVA